MTDPTQEQRPLEELLKNVRPATEAELKEQGENLAKNYKPGPRQAVPFMPKMEQGASMGPELPPLDRKNARVCHPEAQKRYGGNSTQYQGDFLIQRETQLLAALNEVQDLRAQLKTVLERESATTKRYDERLEAAEAEVSKLSTRIDEIQLAETRAVEELARVREENRWLLKRMGVALELIQSKHAKRHFNMFAEGIVKVLDTNKGGELPPTISNDHPESKCQLCGGANYRWHVDSPDWNAAMRSGDEPDVGSIVCPNCFMRQSQKMGIDQQWHIEAER